MGEAVGGVECVAALDLAFTVSVTELVEHVDVEQFGVPWFVKIALLLIVSPFVSVLLTMAWKVTLTASVTPGPTTIPDQLTVPDDSVTLQLGAPPQEAEPGR